MNHNKWQFNRLFLRLHLAEKTENSAVFIIIFPIVTNSYAFKITTPIFSWAVNVWLCDVQITPLHSSPSGTVNAFRLGWNSIYTSRILLSKYNFHFYYNFICGFFELGLGSRMNTVCVWPQCTIRTCKICSEKISRCFSISEAAQVQEASPYGLQALHSIHVHICRTCVCKFFQTNFYVHWSIFIRYVCVHEQKENIVNGSAIESSGLKALHS